MALGNDSGEKQDENARMFAKSGAQLGAAAGGRIGPVTTGLASGLGGAVGYLAGSAVDGVMTSIEEGSAVTDGGHPPEDADAASSGIEITVTTED